jgi:hypothetical protein
MNFVFGSAVDEAADLNNQREGHAQWLRLITLCEEPVDL